MDMEDMQFSAQTEAYNPQKIKNCKACGELIAKTAKRCPYCGAKNRKPFFRRVSTYIILLLLIAIITIFAIAFAELKPYRLLSDDAYEMPEADFKAACKEVDYKDILRSPDSYMGIKAKFTGEVLQAVYESDNGFCEYLVSVTENELGYYTDEIWVYYYNSGGPMLLKDDNITMYGELIGDKTYKSVGGDKLRVPAFDAVYITINE